MTPLEPMVIVPARWLHEHRREKSFAWCLGVLAGFGASFGVVVLMLRDLGVPI